MTAKPAHVYTKQMVALLERGEDNDVGVVLHNLSYFFDNSESISQILDRDTSIQDEFLAIKSEVYGFFVLRINLNQSSTMIHEYLDVSCNNLAASEAKHCFIFHWSLLSKKFCDYAV